MDFASPLPIILYRIYKGQGLFSPAARDCQVYPALAGNSWKGGAMWLLSAPSHFNLAPVLVKDCRNFPNT